MKNYTITSEQIDNMKHCIGFDQNKVTGTKYRKMKAYRNYFTTCDNDKDLDNLVDQGLMVKRDFANGCGDNPKVYFVSDEGFEFLSDLTEIEIIEGK